MTPAGEPFSLLIKPAAADCNLNCTYCFYLDRAGLYPAVERRMTARVLERLVSGFLEMPQERHVFAWQGGEPALMGVGFFEQVVTLQERYFRAGAAVANCLQTNALLIDDEFAAFLARNRFLLGVSLDGPAAVHDRYRRHADGTGTHADVMRGIERLNQNGVQFNVVAVVSKASAGRGREIYRYLRDQGFHHQQYVECVEFDGSGCPQPYSISSGEWGEFLCAVFDEWIAGDVGRVSVRLFDALLARLVQGCCTVCSMGSACGGYAVVEFNGDVYPCDFFVRPELRAGNIADADWRELLASPVFKRFAARKREWGSECGACEYVGLCQGDCPKNRPPITGDARPASRLCRGWKEFYGHSLPRFRELARQIARSQDRSNDH